MTAKCFCDNCHEYILDIVPESINSPLKGHMFKQRVDTEWAIFHESYEGLDLTCPICEWTMHTDEHITVEVNGEKMRGKGKDIREWLEEVMKIAEAEQKEAEKPKKAPQKRIITFRCRHCKKEIPEGKYCSDECLKADFGNPKRRKPNDTKNTQKILKEVLNG